MSRDKSPRYVWVNSCSPHGAKSRDDFRSPEPRPGTSRNASAHRGIMGNEKVSLPMAAKSDSELGINSWLEDELHQQYLHDRSSVDASWKSIFDEPLPASANGTPTVPTSTIPTAAANGAGGAAPPAPEPNAELQALRGVAGKIAENMTASVAIPLATSQRTIAVKVMDENRRITNQHRTLVGNGKVS